MMADTLVSHSAFRKSPAPVYSGAYLKHGASRMRLQFTSATISDVETVLRMMRTLQEDDPWSCAFDEQLVRRTVSELLQDPAAVRVWLVRDDNQPIGYIVMAFDYSLEYGGKGAWVDEFFVEPAYRGRGVGTEALRFFEKAARDLGVKTIYLEVNHGNRALGLYRKLGFEDHQRYLMMKRLTDSPQQTKS